MRCFSAAQMTLCFIDVQNAAYEPVKPGVDRFQPFGYILVNRAFSNAQCLCGVSHSRFVFNDISSFFTNAFFVPVQ